MDNKDKITKRLAAGFELHPKFELLVSNKINHGLCKSKRGREEEWGYGEGTEPEEMEQSSELC